MSNSLADAAMEREDLKAEMEVVMSDCPHDG